MVTPGELRESAFLETVMKVAYPTIVFQATAEKHHLFSDQNLLCNSSPIFNFLTIRKVFVLERTLKVIKSDLSLYTQYCFITSQLQKCPTASACILFLCGSRGSLPPWSSAHLGTVPVFSTFYLTSCLISRKGQFCFLVFFPTRKAFPS